MLALLAASMASPCWLGAEPAPSSGAARWRNTLIINALGGLDDPNPGAGSEPFSQRVLQEARASGLTAVNVTTGYISGDMEPFEMTVRDVARLDAHVRDASGALLKVLTSADILRARVDRRIGVIFGFQNAAMLGEDASRVEIFADLGVRVIQLTYNPPNRLGDGSAAPENRGLTPFGHAVVEQLNAHRVMVDLSHSGQNTCLDAARASRQPISINHTGCRALVDLPRNKTDEELRLVASRGGFIGIYFMPFLSATGHATADDVVAHIDHAVSVCGEDHVGIGTDGSVTSIDDVSGYMAVLAKEIETRRKAGISAAGERPDTLPFVLNLRGVNQFYELADRLQKHGYSSSRIEKILGTNFLRFAREIWGA